MISKNRPSLQIIDSFLSDSITPCSPRVQKKKQEKILDADCDVGVGAAPPLQCLLEKTLGWRFSGIFVGEATETYWKSTSHECVLLVQYVERQFLWTMFLKSLYGGIDHDSVIQWQDFCSSPWFILRNKSRHIVTDQPLSTHQRPVNRMATATQPFDIIVFVKFWPCRFDCEVNKSTLLTAHHWIFPRAKT